MRLFDFVLRNPDLGEIQKVVKIETLKSIFLVFSFSSQSIPSLNQPTRSFRFCLEREKDGYK